MHGATSSLFFLTGYVAVVNDPISSMALQTTTPGHPVRQACHSLAAPSLYLLAAVHLHDRYRWVLYTHRWVLYTPMARPPDEVLEPALHAEAMIDRSCLFIVLSSLVLALMHSRSMPTAVVISSHCNRALKLCHRVAILEE